ncbi:hypothetical protein SPRG_00103 [Saprolegnia parasitica CBS 223.65]|uniref:Uncharacterized protein n=1 Tax=Saprolegnia parasitica (strain CBS 223.65) TaxID=695850 RepID=A0A067D8D5_SAPPC|nr:hypothetical protein SPRG_00103 [Saprolegnia parasitica CBS 223.65]KDO35257.1 hypothetical protein SPRG_00103 [Saprolegnia parasitica CBS 223.65]|eukprot:XP_012193608.1 hypothetical protein SPRG_00103 [Saprolegnia parasitica CBS 223.65]
MDAHMPRCIGGMSRVGSIVWTQAISCCTSLAALAALDMAVTMAYSGHRHSSSNGKSKSRGNELSMEQPLHAVRAYAGVSSLNQ